MPKGYWVGHVDISDLDGYRKYQLENEAVFRKYGARFLVRGGTAQVKEGSLRSRHLVAEFESYEMALACYESPEYAATAALRDGISTADFVIVEGYGG